ncbi:MAG: hypothetical protein WBB28_01455 [Crinalium sp.]
MSNILSMRIAAAQMRSLELMITIVATGEISNPEFEKKIERNPDGTFKRKGASGVAGNSPSVVGNNPNPLKELTRNLDENFFSDQFPDYYSLDAEDRRGRESEILSTMGINRKEAKKAISDFHLAYLMPKEQRDELQAFADKAEANYIDVATRVSKGQVAADSDRLTEATQNLMVGKGYRMVLSKQGGFDDLGNRYKEILDLSEKAAKTSNLNEKKQIENQLDWRSGVLKSEIKYGDLISSIISPQGNKEKDYEKLLARLQKSDKPSGTVSDLSQRFPSDQDVMDRELMGVVSQQLGGFDQGGSNKGGILPDERKQMIDSALKHIQRIQKMTNTETNLVLSVNEGHRAFILSTLATEPGRVSNKANQGSSWNKSLDKTAFYKDPSVDGLIGIGTGWAEDTEAAEGIDLDGAIASEAFHEAAHMVEIKSNSVDASIAFRQDRTIPGTPPLDMGVIGMPGETAVQDHFANVYSGSIARGGVPMTEVVSTGMQAVATFDGLINLASADREHLMYTLSVMDKEQPILEKNPPKIEEIKASNKKALSNISDVAKGVDKLPEQEQRKLTNFLGTVTMGIGRELLASSFDDLHKSAGDAYKNTVKIINETLAPDGSGVVKVLKNAQNLVTTAMETAIEQPEYAAIGAIGAITTVAGFAGVAVTASLPTFLGVGGTWAAIAALIGKETLKQVGMAYIKGGLKQVGFNVGLRVGITGILAMFTSGFAYTAALKQNLIDKQNLRDGIPVKKKEKKFSGKNTLEIKEPVNKINIFALDRPYHITYKGEKIT